MGNKVVFLAQRGDAAHAAMVAFDDDRAAFSVHASCCRERARAMPSHRNEPACGCTPMQHAMDFIGGEHRPVRQRQFQAHAMHLMRHVHGLIPDRPTDRSAPVSGIDQ